MLAITINDVCHGATVTTKPDEHNGLLRQLTGIIGNPVLADHLAKPAQKALNQCDARVVRALRSSI